MTCIFCSQNIEVVDYKDTETLKRFLSPSAKIRPRKKTNLCRFHQSSLAKAIKRARQMALLPFTV